MRLNMTSLFLCLCSIAALAAPAGKEETDYMAVMLQGSKIGYVIHTRCASDSIVRTTEQMTITIGRGPSAVVSSGTETSIETADGKPLGFEMTQQVSTITTKRTGKITPDGKLNVTTEDAAGKNTQILDWPEGALLAEGLKLAQEKRGLKKGDSYKMLVFRPDMLQALPATITVGDKKQTDLLGRVVELTEVTTSITLGAETLTVTAWVDDDLKAKKAVSPIMGMTMEMLDCPKEFALAPNDTVDFLARLTLKSPRAISSAELAGPMIYELIGQQDKPVNIPSDDSQSVRTEPDGKIIVIVRPATMPAGCGLPYKGSDPAALAALEPTEYIQCADKQILDLTKSAVGDTTDAAKAAAQIESFVHDYITQKDLSIGYASALEVAKSRQGDCTEHAILAAAMCRAAGIPARIAAGIVYADEILGMQSAFGAHMWTQVYLNGKWYGLDATRWPGGFSSGHIALALGNGDPTNFYALVNRLGCFEIGAAVPAGAAPAKTAAQNFNRL